MIWPNLIGAQGAAGAQGATGAQGVAGTQGVIGAQGAAGAQGATGTQGAAGAQGATGAQGAPGTSGAVRQIVYGSTQTEVIADTAGYEDLGLSASITPGNAANNVIIVANVQFYATRSTSSVGFGIQIRRGSTVIYETAESTVPVGFFQNAGTATSITSAGIFTIQCRDNPNTTNAVTYSVWGKVSNTANSGQIAFQANQTIDGTSTLTLTEIA